MQSRLFKYIAINATKSITHKDAVSILESNFVKLSTPNSPVLFETGTVISVDVQGDAYFLQVIPFPMPGLLPGQGLACTKDLEEGACFLEINFNKLPKVFISEERTQYSVQHPESSEGSEKHFVHPLSILLNHGNNCRFGWDSTREVLQVIATEAVVAGELVGFNYNRWETEVSENFEVDGEKIIGVSKSLEKYGDPFKIELEEMYLGKLPPHIQSVVKAWDEDQVSKSNNEGA